MGFLQFITQCLILMTFFVQSKLNVRAAPFNPASRFTKRQVTLADVDRSALAKEDPIRKMFNPKGSYLANPANPTIAAVRPATAAVRPTSAAVRPGIAPRYTRAP